ncbi:dockerin type I domain-containing protein [Dolichospermum sp. ST_sed3]|nr:dockerin type I domain-containing protein [Dolichospermum sp. ST_sed3]
MRKLTADFNVDVNTNFGIAALINGDVVDNNEVDFSDINAVRAAYGSFPGDETWNEMADVDGNGEVDFVDINLVRSNYGEIGN